MSSKVLCESCRKARETGPEVTGIGCVACDLTKKPNKVAFPSLLGYTLFLILQLYFIKEVLL